MVNILITKKLYKGQKGSVSIMLVIIMVPLLLLSSFLVDVVRVKSYSQDALMAADNYAEAYLAEYNNLLKQLYGLYAVSNSSVGMEELKTYDGIVRGTFTPENSIFTPYSNLNFNLEAKMLSDSTLSHREVIRTQLTDFMRFRIAQMLLMDGEEVIGNKDASEGTTNIADKADILAAKAEFDEKNADCLKDLLTLYDKLEKFHDLQDLDDEMKKALLDGADEFAQVAKTQIDAEKAKEAEEYQKWQKANEGKAEKDKTEFSGLSKDDKAKLRKDNDVEKKFDEAIGGIQDTEKKYTEKMKDLSTILSDIDTACNNVIDKLKSMEKAKDALYKKLNEYKGTDTQVITSIKNDVEKALQDYGAYGGKSSSEILKELSERLQKDKDVPNIIGGYLKDAYEKMNDDKTKFVSADIDAVLDSSAFQPIKDNSWEKIEATVSTSTVYHDADKNIYERLKKIHDAYSGVTSDEAAKRIKDATDKENEAYKKLDKLLKGDKPDKKARDIPKNLGDSFGDNESVYISMGLGSMLKGIFKNGSSLFKTYDEGANGWAKAQISRVMVPYYDFGMFTCRTTGKKLKDGQQNITLTGMVQDGSNNWMYGAEIEYILCNHKKAESNLNEIRNRIIVARLIMNYWATYTVGTINGIIQGLAAVAAALSFGTAYTIVDQGLRIAVTIGETVADWDILTDGDKICFVKSSIKEMSAVSEIGKLLGKDWSASKTEKNSIKWFSYIKICKVFMYIFLDPDTIVDRTANLIMVNTNYIIMGEDAFKNIKGKSALKVNFDTAYTAVEVTAKVNSKNVVMNTGWQRWVSPEMSTAVNNIFGRQYSYSVVRGY